MEVYKIASEFSYVKEEVKGTKIQGISPLEIILSEVEYNSTRKVLSLSLSYTKTATVYGELGIYCRGFYYPLIHLTSSNKYIYPLSTLTEVILMNEEHIYLLLYDLVDGDIVSGAIEYKDKVVR